MMKIIQQTGVLCLLFLSRIHFTHGNRIAEGPINQTVHAGESVVLSCSVEWTMRNNRYVIWYKSSLASEESTQLSHNDRTSSSVDQQHFSIVVTGDYQYNLIINNCDVTDIGYYYCAVFIPGGNPNYGYSTLARLDVLDPSIQPTCGIVTSDSDTLEVGDVVTLTCNRKTRGSSSLTMWKGDSEGSKVAGPLNRLEYSFQLTEDDRNKRYVCTPSGRYPDINNCTVTPLTSTITLTPKRGATELGGDVRFSCLATGTPSFNIFTWVIRHSKTIVSRITETTGRYIVSTNGESGRLTITNVQLSDNNTRVRCRASNSLGEEQTSRQAKVFIQTVKDTLDISISDEPDQFAINDNDNSVDVSKEYSYIASTPRTTVVNGQTLDNGPSQVQPEEQPSILDSNNPVETPQNSVSGIVFVIIVSLLVMLVLTVIIVLYIRRKQGKPTPRILTRLSINHPLVMKDISFKPRFVQRATKSRGKHSGNAKNTIEVVHRRRSTLKSNPADTEKRSSLRDSNIELVVNPPPPDWQFRNVKDVDELQRDIMIFKQSPTGNYSSKEIDLLNSLITGNVKRKTLDATTKNDVISDDTCDDDDADSQFESDFDEDEFDEPMSDSGNRAIAPSPRAPPRRKRVKRPTEHDAIPVSHASVDANATDAAETKGTLRDDTALSGLVQASSEKAGDTPIYSEVNKKSKTLDGPSYASVNFKKKSAVRK